MTEWIRFGVTALLLLGGVLAFAAAVTGNFRFRYVLDRMHSAGIGDSLGFFLVIAGLVVSAGSGMDILKMILLVVFLWCTSPVTSHFLADIEMGSGTEPWRHFRDLRRKPKEEPEDENGEPGDGSGGRR